MALRPCFTHGLMFRGPARHSYPTLVTPNGSYSNHLRQCESCFTTQISAWESNEMNAQDGLFEPGDRPNCPECNEPCGEAESAQFFCTTYAKGDDRADWWAPVHESCCGSLTSRFQLVIRP